MKFPKTLSPFILFLLMALSGVAQNNMMEEIRQSIMQKGKLDFRVDSRNAFITNQNVRVFGIKLGLQHQKIFYYGIGYNFLRSKIEKPLAIENNGVIENSIGEIKFNYWSPYVGYTFYRKNNWELSMPIQLGFGNSWIQYKDKEGEKQQVNKNFVFLYEPHMTAQYTFLRYFAVGGGFGYRLMIKNNKALDEEFTSPVYVVKLKLLMGELFKDAKNTFSISD